MVKCLLPPPQSATSRPYIASSPQLTEPRLNNKASPSQCMAFDQQSTNPSQRPKPSPLASTDGLEEFRRDPKNRRSEHAGSSASSDSVMQILSPGGRRIARSAMQDHPASESQQECTGFSRFPALFNDHDSLDTLLIGMLKKDKIPIVRASAVAVDLGQWEQYSAIDVDDVLDVFKEIDSHSTLTQRKNFWESFMSHPDDEDGVTMEFVCDVLDRLFYSSYEENSCARDDTDQHWESPAQRRQAFWRNLPSLSSASYRVHKGERWLEKFSRLRSSDSALDIIYIGMKYHNGDLEIQAERIAYLLLTMNRGKYIDRNGHSVEIAGEMVADIYEYLDEDMFANNGNPQRRWTHAMSLRQDEVIEILHTIQNVLEDNLKPGDRYEDRRFSPSYEHSYGNNSEYDSDEDFAESHDSEWQYEQTKTYREHRRRVPCQNWSHSPS